MQSSLLLYVTYKCNSASFMEKVRDANYAKVVQAVLQIWIL